MRSTFSKRFKLLQTSSNLKIIVRYRTREIVPFDGNCPVRVDVISRVFKRYSLHTNSRVGKLYKVHLCLEKCQIVAQWT